MLKDTRFKKVDVFYRDYRIIFDSVNGVIEWWASAGLRPYLEMLHPREQEYFKYAVATYGERGESNSPLLFLVFLLLPIISNLQTFFD